MTENETKQTNDFSNLEENMPESMHPAFEALVKYKKQITMGIAAVLIVGVVIGLVRWQGARAELSAQNEFGEILMTAQGEERITKLEALLADAPSSIESALLLELGEACMQEGNFDKAAEHYAQLAKDSDASVSVIATMGQAKAQLMAGKADAAYDLLTKLSGNAPEAFTGTIFRQMALSAEAAGKDQAALEAWEKLLETPTADKDFIEYKLQQLKK